VLALLLVVCGRLMAPTTVVGSTLLDTVAPAGTVTEAFAAMVMGIVAGTAIGNALGGTLVDSASFTTAVLVAGAIAVAGAALALARRRTLR
jgi:predicted MFS family arabinose efflux permease